MSFDVESLKQAVDKHGQVCRVVVAKVKGSGPREAGAWMLIWKDGQSGTIGGGALEMQAAERARAELGGADWVHPYALGPGLGQCCGGTVTVLAETYDAKRVATLDDAIILRQVSGTAKRPGSIDRAIKSAKSNGAPVAPQMDQGWMVEPVLTPEHHIWIYGAGHVGRALVGILEPFPEIAVAWVDTTKERYPPEDGSGPTRLVAANMAEVVKFAPKDAHHLIVTFSHTIDLEICHAALSHEFASVGLIGSATKWRRFQKRLTELGHSQDRIAKIMCPIGARVFGKHPQAIAVGVVAELLSRPGFQTQDTRPKGG